MSQVNEEHMNAELDYITKNNNISIPESINNSTIEMKYGFLIFKYISLLKEDSKRQENKEKDLMKNVNFQDKNIIINIDNEYYKKENEKENEKNQKNEEKFWSNFLNEYEHIKIIQTKIIEKNIVLDISSENDSEKSNTEGLLQNNLKERKSNPKSYTIVKNNKIDDIIKIYNIIIINNIIAVLVEDGLRFYNLVTLELVLNLNLKFGNNIIKLKDGNIIGKVVDDNYALIINPSNLNYKKKYFCNSNSRALGTETQDEKIMLVGTYELYIYSKFNDIYVLTKIINILNTSTIYKFQTNSIIIQTSKDQLYEYSVNDFNLLKYKNYEPGELYYLKENEIISHHQNKKNLISTDTKLSLINSETFEEKITYKIDKIITSIKILNKEELLITFPFKLKF